MFWQKVFNVVSGGHETRHGKEHEQGNEKQEKKTKRSSHKVNRLRLNPETTSAPPLLKI